MKSQLMKKLFISLLLATLFLPNSTHAYGSAIPEKKEIKNQYSDYTALRAVGLSQSLDLSAGDTFKKRFKTSRWFKKDHNAFEIKLSNVVGSYKVMILGGDDYFFTSNDYSNKGVTITVSNVKPDKSYTVSVINTASNKRLKAELEIQSFIKK